MLFKPLLAVAVLAASVVADNATPIINAFQEIKTETIQLKAAIDGFNSRLGEALPILTATIKVGNEVDKGTRNAKKVPALTDAETFSLIPYVSDLAGVAGGSIDALIAKKPLFDKFKISGITKDMLVKSRKKSAAFSDAVNAKVPAAYREAAKNLAAPIDAGYARAIQAFS